MYMCTCNTNAYTLTTIVTISFTNNFTACKDEKEGEKSWGSGRQHDNLLSNSFTEEGAGSCSVETLSANSSTCRNKKITSHGHTYKYSTKVPQSNFKKRLRWCLHDNATGQNRDSVVVLPVCFTRKQWKHTCKTKTSESGDQTGDLENGYLKTPTFHM